MTKFQFPTSSGYNIIIEAENEEKAKEILKNLTDEAKNS